MSGPQGPPVPPRPTNTLAIAALVASFICGPAGLIMGVMARQQVRERNEGGDGLALAAIVIGGLSLAGTVLLICLGAAGGGGAGSY